MTLPIVVNIQVIINILSFHNFYLFQSHRNALPCSVILKGKSGSSGSRLVAVSLQSGSSGSSLVALVIRWRSGQSGSRLVKTFMISE